ncbi:DnaJ family domain-containing protein, partial [Escherichia coli]|uniref:DnaJ family domain-containing protein n=1 Tax=Escherichia coli TaxID=562 RepID=UPI00098B5670
MCSSPGVFVWLHDQWADRHITEAQVKGEFDNLQGNGGPLILDDDSHVPPELRAGYRLFKNDGCLQPELAQSKDEIQLLYFLKGIRKEANHTKE